MTSNGGVAQVQPDLSSKPYLYWRWVVLSSSTKLLSAVKFPRASHLPDPRTPSFFSASAPLPGRPQGASSVRRSGLLGAASVKADAPPAGHLSARVPPSKDHDEGGAAADPAGASSPSLRGKVMVYGAGCGA